MTYSRGSRSLFGLAAPVATRNGGGYWTKPIDRTCTAQVATNASRPLPPSELRQATARCVCGIAISAGKSGHNRGHHSAAPQRRAAMRFFPMRCARSRKVSPSFICASNPRSSHRRRTIADVKMPLYRSVHTPFRDLIVEKKQGKCISSFHFNKQRKNRNTPINQTTPHSHQTPQAFEPATSLIAFDHTV